MASPGLNSPMTRRVQIPGDIVRSVADRLTQELEGQVGIAELCQLLAPRSPNLGFDPLAIPPERRLAWNLVGQWLTGYALGALDRTSTVAHANEWFQVSSTKQSRNIPDHSLASLANQLSSAECFALLPYLLDPLAMGTRRGTLTSDEQVPSRRMRKNDGIFYTPADVASFMARRLIKNSQDVVPSTALDPAAGSGVFLRAAASEHPNPEECRYFGIDLAPLASDFTSYVLLASLGHEGWPSPWARWHSVRIDQATTDTLFLSSNLAEKDQVAVRRSVATRKEILLALEAGVTVPHAAVGEPVSDLVGCFPELEQGSQLILTNPPYSPLGNRAHDPKFLARYTLLSEGGASPSTNVYSLFVEQSIKFLSKGGKFSAVVPLSITFSSDRIARCLRRMISCQGGRIEFMSFDRTPDALFGDDVKTRNAIVSICPHPRNVTETTGLMRWTSKTRSEMFSSVRTVPIQTSIVDYVPKLNSTDEANFYTHLNQTDRTLQSWIQRSRGVAVAQRDQVRPSLWIAQTAYNWIGCAADSRPLAVFGHDSSSSFNVHEFVDIECALAAYAIVACRTSYFLWRVIGDGFHVTNQFIANLPVPVDSKTVHELFVAGEEMWRAAQSNPVISRNRSKNSVSLRPPRDLVEVADRILLRALNVRCPFNLEEWYEQSVVVDPTDARRTSRFSLKGN